LKIAHVQRFCFAGELRDKVCAELRGALSLLDAMAEARVTRLVFASTAPIYGTPDAQPMSEDLPDSPPHPYAASKAAAEAAIDWQARSGALGAAALRIFNAVGGVDRDPERLLPRVLAVAAGTTPQLIVNGDGSVVRDCVHVADVAEAFVAAVERVTGRPIPVVHRDAAPERTALISDPSRAVTELGWKPRSSDLDDIVRDDWAAVS
jgi:UDP-glucose 4-epimerase